MRWSEIGRQAAGIVAVAGVTLALRTFGTTNATTVALAYLLIVLFVASTGSLLAAVVTSFAATLALNFFFLPPIGTLTIADPHNWVALAAFLVVSIVASRLSTSAQHRAQEALERRNELTRLFDVTRDILLTTERERAIDATALHVARRFELDSVAICLPSARGGWNIHRGGAETPPIDERELDRALARARGTLEFDATTRAYGGQRTLNTGTHGLVHLVPIRLGTRAIGVLAVGGRALEAGTRDAIAGVVAIAVERSQFLEERRQAEMTAERAELSSALLAALGHDLRTPLTAVRVALSNVLDRSQPEGQREEQAALAMREVERLNRLFQEILDMARIETQTVHADRQWATAVDVIDAARTHAAPALTGRQLRVDADERTLVEIDPRLTSIALAHLLENAAHYSPPDSMVEVRGWTDEEGLRLTVTDQGRGVLPEELDRLFEPFFRGSAARQLSSGTGMGLSISRGLLAAQGGRVWAENVAPHGARFSIAVPGRTRTLVDNGVTA
jgi:two-component system, OmpR family, sensor histidine kinase KdpD